MDVGIRSFLALITTLAIACGGPPDAPAPDGGPPVPDAGSDPGTDAGPPFDPTMTYPGEGEACEFSILCGELQICVDGECARHERFSVEDLEVGAPVRIPHEVLRTSTIYEGASFDWDTDVLVPDLLGTMAPGRAGPMLVLFARHHDNPFCPVLIYGDGPPRTLAVPGIRCTAIAINPDGYMFVGGTSGPPDDVGRWALVEPDGAVISEGRFPSEWDEHIQASTGTPGHTITHVNSVLWHEDRFLFSAAIQLPSEWVYDPTRHTLFGELSLDGTASQRDVAGSSVHDRSYGWLVRDELGIHSILTRYEYAEDEIVRTQTDLVSWSTGETRPLLQAAGGLGKVGRYFQPTPSRWAYAAFEYPERCMATLYEGDAELFALPILQEPCGLLSVEPENYGYSMPYMAGYTSHSLFKGASVRLRGTPPTRDTLMLVDGLGDFALTSEEAPPGLLAAFHVIARFHKTIEVISSYTLGGQLFALEAPLSRRTP